MRVDFGFLDRKPSMSRQSRAAICLLAVLLSASGLAACDAGTDSGGAAPDAPAAAPAVEETRATVTHILIAYKGGGVPKVTRSKEEALKLARSLLADLVGGRKMEGVVDTFSDDSSKTGNHGVFVFRRDGSMVGQRGSLVPEFVKAAFETPVGKMAPEPVETKYGYHLIRRDR